jgi:hypothetical protein
LASGSRQSAADQSLDLALADRFPAWLDAEREPAIIDQDVKPDTVEVFLPIAPAESVTIPVSSAGRHPRPVVVMFNEGREGGLETVSAEDVGGDQFGSGGNRRTVVFGAFGDEDDVLRWITVVADADEDPNVTNSWGPKLPPVIEPDRLMRRGGQQSVRSAFALHRNPGLEEE